MQRAHQFITDSPVTIRGDALRWRDLLSVPDELEELARRGGIPIGKGNRLDIYRRVIRKHYEPVADGIRMANGDIARRLLCAGAELRNLRFIVRQLRTRRAWRRHFESVFGGAEHHSSDRNHDTRSKQAELYVAARLAWMGLSVEPGEPDIVATWNRWRFGVAVKRLRSEQQYRRRLHEGFDQITRARMPGMVAVDLTPLLWFDNKPVFVSRADGMSVVTLKMLQEFIYQHHARPMAMQRGGLPFGAIYFATMAARALPDGQPQFCTGHVFTALCEENDPRKERALGLNRLLHRRAVQVGDTVEPILMHHA